MSSLSTRIRQLEQAAATRGGNDETIAQAIAVVFWGGGVQNPYDNLAPPEVNDQLRRDLRIWAAAHPGASIMDLLGSPPAVEAAGHIRVDVGMVPRYYATEADHAAAMAEWIADGDKHRAEQGLPAWPDVVPQEAKPTTQEGNHAG